MNIFNIIKLIFYKYFYIEASNSSASILAALLATELLIYTLKCLLCVDAVKFI